MPIASIHVPRQQRSRATRARPREETIERLIEHGWPGTTTTVVASRAGVSRGAQLHHYPTRAALVTAAMAHLAERRAAALPAGTQRLDRLTPMPASPSSPPPFTSR